MAGWDQSILHRVLLLVAVVSLLGTVQAQHHISRQKRVSDQRLAELETLIGLSRMKGKLVTVPVGYGLIDPARLGKRKRSAWQQVGGPWRVEEPGPRQDGHGASRGSRNDADYFSVASDGDSDASQYENFPDSRILQLLSDYPEDSDDYGTQVTL